MFSVTRWTLTMAAPDLDNPSTTLFTERMKAGKYLGRLQTRSVTSSMLDCGYVSAAG